MNPYSHGLRRSRIVDGLTSEAVAHKPAGQPELKSVDNSSHFERNGSISFRSLSHDRVKVQALGGGGEALESRAMGIRMREGF